jgi:hypothetical protein
MSQVGKLPIALFPCDFVLPPLARLCSARDILLQLAPIMPVEPHVVLGVSGRKISDLAKKRCRRMLSWAVSNPRSTFHILLAQGS